MPDPVTIDLDHPPDSPWPLFGIWFADAQASEAVYPEGMTLATVDAGGRPSARIVLLKAWDDNSLIFHTNYHSRKGGELSEHPQAAVLFHWKSLERQVRVEGQVAPAATALSDAYFAQRPRASQIGAWASLQSQPLGSRATFERRIAEMEERFAGNPVPRPPHWGGFCLSPDYFEFWQERAFRLHDRITYRVASAGGWTRERLYP